MAFTKSTVATNNISTLPNKPLITATALKQKFDQYGSDDKTYVNNLIDELEVTTGTSGSENIGSKTISGLPGNTIWAQLSAIWTAVQNIVIGTLPDNSVTNDKIATASKIGLLADLTTSVKTNIVAAINSIAGTVMDGVITWAKLAPDMQNRELMQDKAITELLMLADIDSKVFSPNLGKFYTNFSTAMDYSLGTIDSTKQTYTGTLSAGATNVVLPSATGFSTGQEISIQDGTNYEEVIVSSVVSTTVSFKTALVNSYTNPSVYRSNNNGVAFGVVGSSSLPAGSVFGLHFDGNTSDFVGTSVPTSNTGTFDTSNKKFGSASIAYNGSQSTKYLSADAFNPNSGDFIFDMWIKNGALATASFIFGKADASGAGANSSYLLRTDVGNTVSFACIIGTTVYTVVSAPAITDTSTFHHIRCGRNGNTINIAVNGVVTTPVAMSGTVNISSSGFSIGQCGEYEPQKFVGNVDEFIISKGTSMDNTNFTPPTAPWTSGVALLKNVIRMNITPYEDVKYISAWLTKTDLAGFTTDGKLSIVDAVADESYVDLTESITDLGATQEVMMIGNSATADSKVTLKLTLNRASTSDSVSFTKLIGGVSA